MRGREQILRVHVRGVTLDPTVDLAAIAARTVGFVFGDASTGAHDDLQHAIDLAREMVTRFGMGDAGARDVRAAAASALSGRYTHRRKGVQ